MIFSIVMLCIGAFYLIISRTLDSVWDKLYSYSVCDKVIKELGLPEDREIWSERIKQKYKSYVMCTMKSWKNEEAA